MAPEDVAKTAILNTLVLFKYLFMPFELSTAAPTFQRLTDHFFLHLPFAFSSVDKHLIAS